MSASQVVIQNVGSSKIGIDNDFAAQALSEISLVDAQSVSSNGQDGLGDISRVHLVKGLMEEVRKRLG